MAAVEVGSDAVQPGELAVVLPVGGEPVAVGEHRGGVEGALHRLGETGYAAGVGAGDGRAKEGLAGHARPVRALAADQLELHDRGGEAAARARSATFSPTGPAPSTTTS